MGLFDLFRRKKQPEPEARPAAAPQPVTAPAQREETPATLEPTARREQKPKKPRQMKRVEMVQSAYPSTRAFCIQVPEAARDAIAALGVDNPDYTLDEAKLRRKGYLFQAVYAKTFPPMEAALTAAPERGGDPDAVAVTVGKVAVGTLGGADGAEAGWLLTSGAIAHIRAEISGGDYVTLECDPEYDESSKRIPADALYRTEDFEAYRVTLTVELLPGAQLAELRPAKKVHLDYNGIDASPLDGCKQSRFAVSGSNRYLRDIPFLGQHPRDFSASMDALAEKGLTNIPIPAYDFPPLETRLVPEPSNKHDPNAIRVMMGGVQVGYVPAARCKELLTAMQTGQLRRVQGGILCDGYRMLAAPGKGENAQRSERRIYREDGDIKVKLFIDIAD